MTALCSITGWESQLHSSLLEVYEALKGLEKVLKSKRLYLNATPYSSLVPNSQGDHPLEAK
jgi:hypothetical protein